MRRNGKSKNLIWILAVLILLTVLSATGVKDAFPETIALEQASRCGLEEHVHGEECYVGDILVCREKMHTHSRNCYLVLLEDNDINELLTRIDAAPDNNLESLISATVLQASMAAQLGTTADTGHEGPVASVSPSPSVSPTGTSSLFPSISPSLTPSMTPSLIPTLSPSPSVSPSADPENTPTASPSQSVTANQPLSVTQQAQPITNRQIVLLNASVDTSQQGVVLNEHLVAYNLSETATEEQLLASLLAGGSGSIGSGTITVDAPGTLTGDTGASTLAVENAVVTPNTGSRAVNLYIYIIDEDGNGNWVCVENSGQYENRRQYYITGYYYKTLPADYLSTINGVVDPDFTSSNGYKLFYSSGSSWTAAYSQNILGTTYTAVSGSSSSETSTAVDLRLYASGTESANDNNAIKFAVITYKDTSGNTIKTSIVRVNQTITVEDPGTGYIWQDQNGNQYSEEDTITVTKSLELTLAQGKITVTYDYPNGTEDVVNNDVVPGEYTVLYDAPDGYVWVGDDGKVYSRGEVIDLNSDFTFTAVKQYTVTLDYPGDTTDTTQKVLNGETITLPEGYDWADGTNTYDGGDTVTITKDTDFVGTVRTYTVTYYDGNGSVLKTDTYEHGETITVSYPLPAGFGYTAWVDRADSTSYDPKDAESIVVKRNYGFDPVSTHTVTYIDKDGKETTETVEPGANVTLPTLNSGYIWVLDGDTSGNTYTAGTYGPVTENLTFRETRALTISYTVGTTGGAAGTNPTIAGTSSTTATQIVTEGSTASLYSVTPRVIIAQENINSGNGFDRVSYFVGWETEDGTVLLPNASYTESELAGYDEDGDNVVELTGVWESEMTQSANFCIRYDITTISGGTESDKYTKSLFTTHASEYDNLSNTDGAAYFGSDASANNNTAALESDKAIRALEGEKAEGFWLYEIPSDEYIFEQLKLDEGVIGKALVVDGLTVSLDELNSDTFAIRWYVVKHYNGDGWHIDGKLVRKVGNITVTKTFDGRADYVEAAQNGFTITARSGSLNDDGEFVDNSSDADITLKLTEASGTDTATSIGYDSRVETTSAGGSTQVTYTWTIPDVGAGEIWNVSENLVTVESAVGFGEWVIVDSSNAQSANGIGTATNVVGVTFPKDVSSSEWLRVDFTNLYYSQNSILLRKIDGLSGQKLDGAQFKMWQRITTNGVVTEVPMTFNLTETTTDGVTYRTYTYVADGTGEHTVIACDGTEINISVENFAYGNGPIVIREVAAPTGYILEEHEVVVGYTDEYSGETPLVGIINGDVSGDYADYSAGLLTVKNFAPTVDITVQKVWRNCTTAEWADYVIVQLLADGSASKAASVLPDGVSTIQTLDVVVNTDGTAGYEPYTWGGLPVYVNGEKVTWSVKELQIGDEEIKADGTFPNWNSYVSAAVYNADNTAATITVTNNPKAGTELRIVKMDTGKTAQVPGATFEIYDADGKLLDTQTTDETGELIFHRLKYETEYTIIETVAPTGYLGNPDPFVVKIAESGTVTIVTNNGNVEQNASNYSVTVTNLAGVELPATGGSGTTGYTLGGLLLMAAALLMLYKKSRRKEDAPYV